MDLYARTKICHVEISLYNDGGLDIAACIECEKGYPYGDWKKIGKAYIRMSDEDYAKVMGDNANASTLQCRAIVIDAVMSKIRDKMEEMYYPKDGFATPLLTTVINVVKKND